MAGFFVPFKILTSYLRNPVAGPRHVYLTRYKHFHVGSTTPSMASYGLIYMTRTFNLRSSCGKKIKQISTILQTRKSKTGGETISRQSADDNQQTV